MFRRLDLGGNLFMSLPLEPHGRTKSKEIHHLLDKVITSMRVRVYFSKYLLIKGTINKGFTCGNSQLLNLVFLNEFPDDLTAE